jgi:hypothetical protein
MTTVKKGATDQTFYFKLVDSAAGTPETGLTITNIDATYVRNRAAAVKNDLTALGAANSAHADNQGIEVDSTNAPGLYRIDFPDAAFATGADKVILSVTCTGCDPAMKEIELVDNVTADAVALLPAALVGGRMDCSVGAMAANTITAAATAADFTTEVTSGLAQEATLATVAGYLDTEIAAIKAKTDNLPASPAAVGSAMTLTAGERNSVADALLDRNVAGGSSAGRLVKEALYVLRNKVAVAAGTLTVYATDDSTAAFTAAVTTAAGDPISTIDPA